MFCYFPISFSNRTSSIHHRIDEVSIPLWRKKEISSSVILKGALLLIVPDSPFVKIDKRNCSPKPAFSSERMKIEM